MSEGRLKRYWMMFTDAWRLFKEFSAPDGTDEFWQGLRDKALELERKHGSRLMVELAVAVMNEISRIYKEQEEQNGMQ